MIRGVLKMGDERLLEIAKPIEKFDTPEMRDLLT
ncbi:MAG: peptide deformylase, partial [Alphaproteobacteria bacterium]|nr:peptide deformylase [Alphaproteobacteria bacterium]